MLKELQAIKNTLNLIEVHGEDNLNSLLGCIQAVNALIHEQSKEVQPHGADDHPE